MAFDPSSILDKKENPDDAPLFLAGIVIVAFIGSLLYPPIIAIKENNVLCLLLYLMPCGWVFSLLSDNILTKLSDNAKANHRFICGFLFYIKKIGILHLGLVIISTTVLFITLAIVGPFVGTWTVTIIFGVTILTETIKFLLK